MVSRQIYIYLKKTMLVKLIPKLKSCPEFFVTLTWAFLCVADLVLGAIPFTIWHTQWCYHKNRCFFIFTHPMSGSSAFSTVGWTIWPACVITPRKSFKTWNNHVSQCWQARPGLFFFLYYYTPFANYPHLLFTPFTIYRHLLFTLIYLLFFGH